MQLAPARLRVLRQRDEILNRACHPTLENLLAQIRLLRQRPPDPNTITRIRFQRARHARERAEAARHVDLGL